MLYALKDIGIISLGSLLSFFCHERKSLSIMSLPFIQYKLNEYELINSSKHFILVVAGSALLLIICVNAKWSTMASKSTLISKCAKLAMLIANPHSSSSVVE